MPRIRLRIELENLIPPHKYHDPLDSQAGERVLPFLRLTTIARIVPPPHSISTSKAYRPIPALIDTGTSISAIDKSTWERLEELGLIQTIPMERRKVHAISIGGHQTQYKLGRLWIGLLDYQPPPRVRAPGVPFAFELPITPVIAQLLLEPVPLPYPIQFGLLYSVLDGRKLTREPVQTRAGPIPANQDSDVRGVVRSGVVFGNDVSELEMLRRALIICGLRRSGQVLAVAVLLALVTPFATAVWMSFAPGELIEPPTDRWSLCWCARSPNISPRTKAEFKFPARLLLGQRYERVYTPVAVHPSVARSDSIYQFAFCSCV